MNKASKGFTLIELVVVITILGILAAFAIPRFASLETEARIAAVQGLAGSIRSGATLAHSLSLAQGKASTDSVLMEGQTIAMVERYPNLVGIENVLVDITGFDYDGAGLFTKLGADDEDTCSVDYGVAAADGAPSVAVDTLGC